jgi:carbon-monoxide dehydrogenase small subunit
MTQPILMNVVLTVNGRKVQAAVEPRTLLVTFLREHLGLTGTHVGCDTTQCGACTVHLDGRSIKSCTALTVQCSGGAVTTIEGLAEGEKLHPLQTAFRACHALQCGFCTPGMIMSGTALLMRNADPSEHEVRDWLEGNICRCTGYHNIVRAVRTAAASMREAAETEQA